AGMPGTPGMPGAGLPGLPGSGTDVGSSSTGGQQGSGRQGGQAGGGIDYGSGDDPFGDLGTAGGSGGSGGMTTAERRAALDARLEAGYAVFDGMILGERERSQTQAD